MRHSPDSPAQAPSDAPRDRSFRLDGKVAALTGAAGGLGRGLARGLAEAGADLLLLGRTQATLDEVAREIAALGRRPSAVVCDVTDSKQVQRALGAPNHIDVLVNNAGFNAPESFLDVSEENLDAMLGLNLRGAFLAAQAAARAMVAAGGGGAIVNISSQMGHVGGRRRSVYCATKHGVEGLTKAMALDLAEHGIRVNSVAPTFVETPLTRPFFKDPAFRADTEARIPLGRLGEVEDVVGAVVFLASPAAALITGTSLLVDGGWTAQ